MMLMRKGWRMLERTFFSWKVSFSSFWEIIFDFLVDLRVRKVGVCTDETCDEMWDDEM